MKGTIIAYLGVSSKRKCVYVDLIFSVVAMYKYSESDERCRVAQMPFTVGWVTRLIVLAQKQ